VNILALNCSLLFVITLFVLGCSPLSQTQPSSSQQPQPVPPKQPPYDDPGRDPGGGPSTQGTIKVPLITYYDGMVSGDDAQFTFYVARRAPIRDRKEVEIIKSVRKRFISATKDNFCQCGEKNEMHFLWRHISGRSGALHTRSQGEWLVGHNVSEPKWMTSGMSTVPTGKHTMFLGADVENPEFVKNPTGQGFLRTEQFSPNSGDNNNIKSWSTRDDMRLALSCDINRCPTALRETTELELIRHESMNPD
jgi:hypothetical protein